MSQIRSERPSVSQPAPTAELNGNLLFQADNPDLLNTHYQLCASLEGMTYPVEKSFSQAESDEASHEGLDPEARAQFQQRLRLCCLIAAMPFLFLAASSATNFIELISWRTIGPVPLILSAVTLVALTATAALLARRSIFPSRWLRALEVGIFGIMGACFAFWQFMILTGEPFLVDGMPPPSEQSIILAAALITHFNWFALIVFHGVLVPNSLPRGAGVAIGMCLLAVSISAVAAATHPPTGRHADTLFAVSLTMLAAAAGLSIFGVAKTEALREEIRTAKQAVREMGQYRLRKVLGIGGMGEVYLAEHRLLKRPCALKRIHPRYLNNPEQMRRFEREVQATARLRHPNTVEIYDYGRAEDGTFYYVMEYLPGISLEEMVAQHGPVSAERVVHWLRQICGALREAHRNSLVHRDIKPSNILITPHGSPHDMAKLLDFGLVHTLQQDDPVQQKITREGLIVGTPEYMSPEQASGTDLDARSDLFSLGSVAYYLLTGQEAFTRANPMKTLLAVVGEEPKPILEMNPFVPTDLAEVIQRCLIKSPEHRFQSAHEMDEALAECGCAGHWTEEQSIEWWDRHPEATPPMGTDLEETVLDQA